MKYLFLFSLTITINLSAQSNRLIGLINNTLVEVDPFAPSLREIVSFNYPISLAELTYSPDQCAFFSIADNVGSPRLIKLLEDGSLEDIGLLSMPSNTIFTCEAMEYNPADGLLYAFGSLDGQELFAESLFIIDPTTAVCRFVTRMVFNTGAGADADNMDFRDGVLYINDGITASGTTDFYSIPLTSLVNVPVTPDFQGRTAYYSVTDQAVFSEKYIFPTAERAVILVDIEDLSVSNSGQSHSDMNFNGGTLAGLSTKPITRDTTTYSICTDQPAPLNGSVYLVSGVYEQSLTSRSGCDSTLIVVAQEERIQINRDTLICAGVEFFINGAQITTPGTYQDTSSAGICDTIFSIGVRFLEEGASFLGPDTTLCAPSYNLNSQAIPLNWADGFTERERSIQESGTYIATTSSDSGCTITDTINVSFESNSAAYLPNAFSPNNDGTNDILNLYLLDNTVPNNYYMSVYDRWGKLLFESSDFAAGWDGMSNEEPLNSGTYLVVVNYEQVGCATLGEAIELVNLLR